MLSKEMFQFFSLRGDARHIPEDTTKSTLEHMFEVDALTKTAEAHLIGAIDAAHADVAQAERRLLSLIAEADRREVWRDDGAHDVGHWVSMRYGISSWKAHRWVAASRVLELLPRLSAVFERGELGIDKVVELCRFASPETESHLIRWAKTVSCGAIRHRGDLAARQSSEGVIEAEEARSLSYWYTGDRRFGLEANLPAAQGAIVVRALERVAEQTPAMPGEDDAASAPAKRADALVALCSARIASDADADRASVIVHARLDTASSDVQGCELEGGPVIDHTTVERLLCNARTQAVVEDDAGNVLGLGRTTREPSAWMVRQVRYRDRECRFPGCGARRFTEAHHVRFWRHGGRTDLDNLLLICSFHHRLVHEYAWSVKRDADGTVRWFRSDGTRYRAGPSPGAASHPPRPPRSSAGAPIR
jgi:hypothetical protein